jgi:hypothetical protein
MLQFLEEGGFASYPILALGIILVAASVRYAIDAEPIRLRFVTALGLALVAMSILATVMGFAAVLGWAETGIEKLPAPEFKQTFVVGMKECTRCALLGGSLLTLALIAVAVGAYRSGRKELKALRP